MRRGGAWRQLLGQLTVKGSSPSGSNIAMTAASAAAAGSTCSFPTAAYLLQRTLRSYKMPSNIGNLAYRTFSSSRSPPAAAIFSPTASAATAVKNWKEVQHRLKRHFEVIRPSYEWTLGTGYNARVAIVNALFTTQRSTHWARLISIFIAEAVTRRDPLTWCYYVPVTAKEEEHLAEIERLDAAAVALANKGLFRAVYNYVSTWLRFLWLIILFSPTVLSAPIALRKQNQLRKDWLQLLRKTLERAGPAFIKWGQWAATRADLFPPDFCKELELLHTQAPAHDFPYTEAAIKSAFGFELSDLFSDFEHLPVASGSIGQIHRGVLSGAGARLTNMNEGSVVAVKVRHPGVSESIERDFALMMATARVAEVIPALKTLRLEESLKQFAAPLREQVDLGREGFYLHAFNYNFRKEKNVSFPVPLYPLVAPAVLVETFEQGQHISTYVARGAGAPYNSELAQVGARTMLHMMVVDNLVHSDLHPGNILVRLEPKGGALGAAVLENLHQWVDKAGVGAAVLSSFFKSGNEEEAERENSAAAAVVVNSDGITNNNSTDSTGAENTPASSTPTTTTPSNNNLSVNVEELKAAIDSTFLRPSIVLLDAGMATRLTPEDQINMVGLFDAFSRLDARAVANWTLRFAGEEQTCQDPEAFRKDLETHFNALKAADAFSAGDTTSGADALAAVLEKVRLHQVNMPGHICATVVTTLVLEGWSHQLDPAHSTLSEVKRIIKLKKGETTLKKAAMWIQGAAVDRQILEHVPQFAIEEDKHSKRKYL
jgi:predicted unusual protein kinase regulating ubiquinone biosynthesis (AarF/ABC1/UbiB family)